MVALLSAISCSLLWAGVTIGSKILTSTLPFAAFAFLRYGLAALCFLPSVLLSKERKRVKVRDLPMLMFLGFILVLAFNMLFYNALYYSSATSVSLIGSTIPILTLIVSIFAFHHTPNRYQLLAFMLSFIGAVLVITEGKMGYDALQGSLGELLMVLASLCQVAYTMALKKVSNHYSLVLVSFATFLSGILFVFPFVANSEFVRTIKILTTEQWGILLAISLFGTALALYLYAYAIKHMGPTRANLVIFSSLPLFVLVLAYVALGEGVSAWQILGGICVISSLVIGLRHTR